MICILCIQLHGSLSSLYVRRLCTTSISVSRFFLKNYWIERCPFLGYCFPMRNRCRSVFQRELSGFLSFSAWWFFLCSLLCALAEGFFGCGGAALFLLFGRSGVGRRRISPPGAALLLGVIAQCSALLLTLLSGAGEIFPAPMALALAASSALGGAVFEKTKKRSPGKKGLRIALCVYMMLAALAGIEQAFIY